jgi:hypothetical protein
MLWSMKRLIGWIVLGLVATLGVTAPAVPVPVELPGGKANWVVSVGGLHDAADNNYANWTRLGWYIFAADGTVRTNYWSWNERDEPMRVDAMTASCGGDIPTCDVQTMATFLTGPTGAFQGTYQTSAGKVDVTWTKDGAGKELTKALTEHWLLEPIPGGKVARISSDGYHSPVAGPVVVPSTFSNYTASFGIGYGSNAPLSAGNKASITEIRTTYGQGSFLGTYVRASAGTVGREPAGVAVNPYNPAPEFDQWRSCPSGKCVGFREKHTSCPSGCLPQFTSKDRIRYLADAPPARNNIYTYWCECLAQTKPCYKANNHVQSLLQIIDDDRKFQGWVGVETSTHVESDGSAPDHDFGAAYWAVLNMVTPDLRGPQPKPPKP